MPRARPNHTPTAIVIGAGIAGLASAIALRRAGFEVQVFDRAQRLEPLGAALSLWPNAMAALEALGAGARISAEAASIPALGVADPEGSWIIAPLKVAPFRGCGARLPTRALLQDALLETLGPDRLHLGIDGAEMSADADLTIDASGIWSTLANDIVGSPPQPAGYGGGLALSGQIDNPSPSAGVEYWGDGERIGVFDAGGGRRYWFYIAEDAARPLQIALPWIAHRIADWPDSARRAVAATSPDALIPVAIHARPAPRRLSRGRTICVGDAGHAMEPNLGQGACQGLEDAVALLIAAQSVAVEEIPNTFERLRLKRVRSIVTQSRQAALPVHGPRLLRTPSRMVLRALPEALNRRQVAQTHRWPADFEKAVERLECRGHPA